MNKGGRPLKEGLDFMRIDVHMDADDKIGLVEMDCGDASFGVLIKLLMTIYSNGYYYPWTAREEKLFCKRRNVDPTLCEAVVEAALKWRFFDPDLHKKYGILTSRGIQKRYFFAVKNRACIYTDPKLLLIPLSDYISDDKTRVSVAETPRGMELQEGETPYITAQNITEQHTYVEDELNQGETESNPGPGPPPYQEQAGMLADLMEGNDPMLFKNKNRTKTIDKWAHDIRLLIDRDGRAVETVEKVIRWSQADAFWKTNILSGAKLRDKFPQLLLKMEQGSNGGPRDGKESFEGVDPEEYYRDNTFEEV